MYLYVLTIIFITKKYTKFFSFISSTAYSFYNYKIKFDNHIFYSSFALIMLSVSAYFIFYLIQLSFN